MQETVNAFVKAYPVIDEEELNRFHRLLENPVGAYEILPLYQYYEAEIASSGYVIHTLEASLCPQYLSIASSTSPAQASMPPLRL